MANVLDNVMRDAESVAANYTSQYLPAAVNENTFPATAADMANAGGILVDDYILPKTEGLKISRDMKGLLDSIDVEIDMSEVCGITQARANHGGYTTFVKSYDGIRTDGGTNFQAEVENLRAAYEKVDGPYPTVEITCTLLEDVQDPKSTLLFDAGVDLGYTPSLTGFKEFRKFLKVLRRQDPALLSSYLKVRLHHEKKTNANNNEWGVIRFELLDAA